MEELARCCPACGEVLGGEPHLAKPFDVAPNTQIKTPRFWVCHKSADQFEAMLKTFREARVDEMMNIA